MFTISEFRRLIELSQPDKNLGASENLERSRLFELVRLETMKFLTSPSKEPDNNEDKEWFKFYTALNPIEEVLLDDLVAAWKIEQDYKMSQPENLLKDIPPGEYLRAWGNYPGAMSLQCIQGDFGGISQDGTCFYLSSKAVEISKTSCIERGHNGPGSLITPISPTLVMVEGEWYRSDVHPGLFLHQ
jgi:hypothetical protein